jgi:hypothetical protein
MSGASLLSLLLLGHLRPPRPSPACDEKHHGDAVSRHRSGLVSNAAFKSRALLRDDDAAFFPPFFENYVNRLDYLHLGIRLTIHNHFMFAFF